MTGRWVRRSRTAGAAVVLTVLATLVPGGADASAKGGWRTVTKTYVGAGYTNFGLAVPGVNTPRCELGVTCVEVPLEPKDKWATFEVSDVTGQSISGWALGWSQERKWLTLEEFCGASRGRLYLKDQERLVIIFAVGTRCLPDGAAPTTGQVAFRIR